MGTEAAAVECPVCGEGFREAPARCFRCETDLSHWWPLDESLRGLGSVVAPAPVVVPPRVVLPAAAVQEVADVAVEVGPGVVAPETGTRAQRRAWLMPVVLMAGLGGALLLHLESSRPPVVAPPIVTPLKARPEPVAPPPASLTEAPAAPKVRPTRTVRYVVQPGDSLWRIAAALKGDARRWPELLAGGSGVDPARLRPGQELRLVVDADTATPD